MKIIKSVFLVLFFLSGLSGLIYEIAWMKELSLIFGNTTVAISTVLTVFFAGLALGSFYFGKLIDKKADALKVYAFLELGIGIYCLLTPWIFILMKSFYIALLQNYPVSYYPQLLIRFVFCFTVLIIPTTLMGGTLPVMSRHFINVRERLGKSVGKLYAVNTLGAVTGCMLTGFFLIKTAGIRNTIYIAAALNLLVAAVSLLIRSRPIEAGDALPFKEEFHSFKINGLKEYVLIVFTISGFASMAYEVLWSRILIMIFGSSTYAFTTLLITFLAGIALGSYVYSRIADKAGNLFFQFSVIEIFIGIFAVITIPVLGISPSFSHKLLPVIQGSVKDPWMTITIIQFVFSAIVIFIPAFLMGTTFPLANRLYNLKRERAGRDIGRIYSFNTIGGILGSFAGGFVLIPFLGIQNSIALIALLNIALGLFLLTINNDLRFSTKMVLSSCFIALYVTGIIMFPRWEQEIFTGMDTRDKGNVIFLKEGIGGTVAVTYGDGIKTLYVDGESESSNQHYSMMTQYLLGYLPLLLHPNPESVMEVGLGGGITLGTAGRYPQVKEIVSVELVGAAREASYYFASENNRILDNPKVRFIINDGRNYLLLTEKKYDIITGNTTHPWTAGASSILSKEYFEICRRRLAKNGLMSLWIPLQFIDPVDLKSIVRTFHSVFPHTSVWFSNMDIILIGSVDKLIIDLKRMSDNFNSGNIRHDLRKVDNAGPFSLLSRFIMDERDLDKYIGNESYMNTDNRPLLEFNAPKSRYVFTLGDNLSELLKFRREISPAVSLIRMEGLMDTDALVAEINRNYISMTHNIRGVIAENRRDKAGAYREYLRAFKLNPDDMIAQHNVADMLATEGSRELGNNRHDLAAEKFRAALDVYPKHINARFGLSAVYIRKNMLDRALNELSQIISVDPLNAKAYNNLGGIYGLQGQHEKAFGVFMKAIEADPYYISSYPNIASYYLYYKKDRKTALQYINKVLKIDPKQKKTERVRKLLDKIY